MPRRPHLYRYFFNYSTVICYGVTPILATCATLLGLFIRQLVAWACRAVQHGAALGVCVALPVYVAAVKYSSIIFCSLS